MLDTPQTNSTLSDLLARVEAATGPDRELDDAINRYFRNSAEPEIHQPERMPGQAYFGPRITASIDAALALVEQKLPNWWWNVGGCGRAYSSSILDTASGSSKEGATDEPARSAPLAILSALLRALVAP